MYQKIRLVALLICITQFVHAEGLVDSLNKVLARKDISLENRITTMGFLARAKCVTDIDGALRLEKEAMQLCRQLNKPATTAYIWSIMVLLDYYHHRDIPKACISADSALFYARQSHDKLALGIAWYRKAWSQNLQGNYKETVDFALEGLKNLEGTDGYTYEASLYYIIGGAYAEWRDKPQQEKYARLCLAAAEKCGDPDNLISANQAMGTYYHYSFQNNGTDRHLLDSTFYYYHRGIDVYKSAPDKVVFKSSVGVIALNVAGLYMQYKIGSYKDSVLPYLNFAIKTAHETKQAAVLGTCYGIMSDIEIENGHYAKAESLLLQGLSSLLIDGIDHTRNRLQLLEGLISLYEKTGNYQKALQYYKDYHKVYDGFFDAEKLKATKNLEEKYQSEKKEQAIKTLSQQNAMNRKMKYLYGFIGLLMVVAGVYIFRSYHFQLKASKQQKQLLQQEKEDADLLARLKQQEVKQLELEKQEAALTARVKEEETRRLLAEQKLLQEREDRLQKDLLAVNLQIEQKDELLQTIQKKIEESTDKSFVVNKINNIIDQNKKSDETFATNKADFDTIRPEFFQQLKEKSGDTLSRLDLKHCIYISLGLTNKEIAQRFGVAPKSILMARYRIKLKLGLGKDDDLDGFIRTLS
ncbi:helix-turn-helix transcriptional regulator [Chitinophaga pinensis]|uniref:HTH luxR-type domain-containing protein n=1 Tax=Chitinophaga pinensis (strain ATCC 43595 / DSM 2588 / LMG 13176 / NBRC 15968 / NCIMB 11800 / UQM 2034) TaxID=485918 RepID=A0A979G773_CHIPD|nr:hypothetical protein [Chitinophaga pinensis]ACU62065.1 hypothetical protein Cpin_4624 [Chitinophaga pinensis DSM 2588]